MDAPFRYDLFDLKGVLAPIEEAKPGRSIVKVIGAEVEATHRAKRLCACQDCVDVWGTDEEIAEIDRGRWGASSGHTLHRDRGVLHDPSSHSEAERGLLLSRGVQKR